MDKEELHQARTNPDFQKYLEQTRKDAIDLKNISAMYEVLDTYLVLDLQEDKINELYIQYLRYFVFLSKMPQYQFCNS
jgi:hypothetical protein